MEFWCVFAAPLWISPHVNQTIYKTWLIHVQVSGGNSSVPKIRLVTENIFSSPEPKAQGELIVWDSSRHPSVRSSVCASTVSNINIPETSLPIIIKFHQEHHWGRGLAVFGFGLDRIRTLVSMATDSSHRVIMGKSCDHSSSFIFDWFFFILAGNEDNDNISNGFEIWQDWTRDLWVSCPWKNPHRLIMGEMLWPL